jgi:hypothetical protein
MLNDQFALDIRQAISGKDGQLYVTNKAGTDIFLAEVDTFTAQFNFENADIQVVGSYLKGAIPLSYSLTLTLTEFVVRDDVMLKELIDDMYNGYPPFYNFKGKLRRLDKQIQRVVYRGCIPDGSVDIQNLTPGEVVKRNWSFRVNEPIELMDYFKGITGTRSDIYG